MADEQNIIEEQEQEQETVVETQPEPSVEPEAETVYTIEQHLYDSINFSIPESAVRGVLKKRGVEGSDEYNPEDTEQAPKVRLLYADLLKWICLGAGRTNRVSDSDNGWSHSEGGYTLSKDDKKLLMNEVNAIYEELEPASVFGKRTIRMRSMGIMPALRDVDGTPLPRHNRDTH